jgi:toxin ParE1/3/4
MKRLAVRPLALAELEEAANYYEGEQAGLGDEFADAFYVALTRLAETPGLGSNQYSHLIPEVRMYVMQRFPYLVFYLDHPKHIEVIRLLHGKRDLPRALSNET